MGAKNKKTSKNKTSRRDLIIVIAQLQDLIGTALGVAYEPKDPGEVVDPLRKAHNLCIETLSNDPPIYLTKKEKE